MTGVAAAAARGGMITLLSQALSFSTRVVYLVVLARLVAPEAFGVVAIAAGVATFATSLALLGLGMAAAQALDLSQNGQSVLSHAQSLVGAAMAAGMFLLADPIASAYHFPRLAEVLQWLALVPLLQGLQSQQRIHLVRRLEFGRIAVAEIAALVVAVAVSVAAAAGGYAYAAIVLQLVVQPLLQLVILLVMTGWLPSLRVRLDAEARGLLGIGGRIMAMNLTRNLARSALTPLMGLSTSTSSLGQFDRAQQLTLAPINLAVDRLQQVAVPVLSQVRGDVNRSERFLGRAHLLITYLVATAFLVFAALSPALITLLLGDRWRIAGVVFGILSVGAVFRVLGESMSWVFISSGATRQGAWLGAWSQPLIVALSLVGLGWGVVGVAVANSVAWFLYWPIACVLACRAAGMSPVSLATVSSLALLRFSLPVAGVVGAVQHLTAPSLGEWSLVAALASTVVVVPLLGAIPAVRRDLGAVIDTVRLGLVRRRG